MKVENKLELKKQQKKIGKSLAFVFIPIFIVVISISLIQNNSLHHLEEEYKEIHRASYSGKITDLLLNEDNGRIRPILINDKWKKEIPFFIHEKLSVGDSLYKKTESDFEYYISNSKTDTIKREKRDVNKFYRKKYFDKLNGK